MTTLLLLDYALIPFCMLDYHRGWTVWRSVYFGGHVGALAVWLVMKLVGVAAPSRASMSSSAVSGKRSAAHSQKLE